MRIGFSMCHGNPISEAIVYFTKNTAEVKPCISHAFPYIGEINGMDLALSADEVLVNIVDANRYKNHDIYSLRIYELSPRIPKEIWVKQLVGKYNQKVYPHFELAWFIYRRIRRIFNPKWTGKNWFSYSQFCSELTVRALRLAGYHREMGGVPANETDGIELENIIRKIDGVKLVYSQERSK